MIFIRKNTLLLFCISLLSISIQSQNKVIDSLKNELTFYKKQDTVRANLLYKLAFSYFQSDLETTELYLGKAEELNNNLNFIKGKANVLYLKGILENIKSNYPESLYFFKQSLKHYQSIRDRDGIATIYTSFAITHFDLSQYEDALVNYKKAFKIYEDLGNKRELATILINEANVYHEIGRYNEAISNYKKALKLSEAINDENGVWYVNLNLAIVYQTQGNYPLAIEVYNKCLEYAQKTGDNLAIANILNNLGETYNHVKKYNTSLDFLQQSLELSLKTGNKQQVAVYNGNIGNVFKHKKEYLKALNYYRISLEISQEINYLKQISISFFDIGEVNLLLNNYVMARENFKKAIAISEDINNKPVLAASYLGIAETYVYEKQYNKALTYALNSDKIASEQNLLDVQKKGKELLSEIYKNLGNYKYALENHQQFKILNDSIFNKENIEKITQLEYEYKYKQAMDSANIRELKLTKTVRDTSQNLEKTQRNLFLGVIIFLILALMLGGFIFFLKLRHEKTKTQNIIIQQKLLRSQMTPHFIFNSLSVLQGMILNKEEKKAVSYLSKFSKLLRITLENSRDKMVPLQQELEAIKNYLELQNLEVSQMYNYNIIVDENINQSSVEIPPMLIQPFIENAIEHAFKNQTENRKIDIKISCLNKQLICTITDNGIGINTLNITKNKDKKSLATTITSERLQMLSKDYNIEGSVTIEDRQKYNEHGTLVTMVFPYKLSSVYEDINSRR
jgi:tetratricopeptide (TPR) repeat protein